MARKSRFDLRRDSILELLEQANSAGRWLPWGGFAAALIWWGAAIGAALAIFGLEQIQSGPALLVSTSGLLVFLPGFLMIMAGLMARQSVRAERVNSIVLTSATRLLSPTKETSDSVNRLADETRQSVEALNNAMGKSVEIVRRMSSEVDAERMKIEAVSYAAADNARDVADRLGDERLALEKLAHLLKSELEAIQTLFPQNLQMLSDGVVSAHREIASAEGALKTRVFAMEQTAERLAERLKGMQALTEDAFHKGNQVEAAIGEIEKKLGRSQELVRNAEAAGNMAAGAVEDAGRRLDAAVTATLSGARELTQQLANQSAAVDVLSEQGTSSQSVATPKVERELVADDAEPPEIVFGASDTEDTAPDSSHELDPEESNDALFEDAAEELSAADIDLFDESEVPLDQGTPAESAAVKDVPVTNVAPKPPLTASKPPRPSSVQSDEDFAWSKILADLQESEPASEQAPVHTNNKPELAQPAQSEAAEPAFRSLIEPPKTHDPFATPPVSREAQIKDLVSRLTGSGIRLGDVFKAKDKRKIATAADRSDEGRRLAVRKCARREIERVQARLRKDPDLRQTAEWFFENEADAAIDTLMNTSTNRRNASPELAAFLLIDALMDGQSGRLEL